MSLVLVSGCSSLSGTPKPATNGDPPVAEQQIPDVWEGSCSGEATGDVYEVGPDQQLAAIGDVPWTDLGPGDRVNIHARPDPYREKILIVGQGTKDEPITICGIAGDDGRRPMIDGADATTRPGMSSAFGATQQRGVITLASPKDSEYGTKPQYVVISGLEITGAYPGNEFSDFSGASTEYPDNAAGIFVERGEWITVRNCVISGNANGLFVASGDAEESVSRHILVDGNQFRGNSVEGRDREHHSYIEAEGTVYQFNHYDDVREGALGGALKDRSAGTIVRYNVIEGGARLLDLVEAEESFDIIGKLPSYRRTWVYGNVLELSNEDGSYAVHYGGDSGEFDAYRKGTLYFYANTVAYRMDQSTSWSGSIFDLATDDETAEIWNNVFYSTSGTADAPATEVSLERLSGVHNLGTNAFSSTIVQWRDEAEREGGSIDGWDRQAVFGGDPGFTNAALGEYRPTSGSVLVDKAGDPPTAIPDELAVQFEYFPADGVRERKPATDLGAYEAP